MVSTSFLLVEKSGHGWDCTFEESCCVVSLFKDGFGCLEATLILGFVVEQMDYLGFFLHF